MPWDTFLGVFNAQDADGISVMPPGVSAAQIAPATQVQAQAQPANSIEPAAPAASDDIIQPSEPQQVCC